MKRPPSEAARDLSNMFGMCEMENAATAIVRIAQSQGQWTSVSVLDFLDSPNDHLIIGFVNLVAHGWIIPDESTNDAFRVTNGFIKRVCRRQKEGVI